MRMECAQIMEKQGFAEPVGQAKITSGYNLPCKYVLHTVGPMVNRISFGWEKLTSEHCRQLASCYQSCMELAEKMTAAASRFAVFQQEYFIFQTKEQPRLQ